MGYNPAYGALPLRRAIQKNLEMQLGFQSLEDEVREGQSIRVDYDQNSKKLVFSPQASPVEAQVAAAKA